MLAKIGAFIIKHILEFAAKVIVSIWKAFQERKKDEAANRETREDMENAKTEDELRDSNRRGSDRLRG